MNGAANGGPMPPDADEGAPHVFVTCPELSQATVRLVDLFLDRRVINPRTYPPFGGGGGGGGGRGASLADCNGRTS